MTEDLLTCFHEAAHAVATRQADGLVNSIHVGKTVLEGGTESGGFVSWNMQRDNSLGELGIVAVAGYAIETILGVSVEQKWSNSEDDRACTRRHLTEVLGHEPTDNEFEMYFGYFVSSAVNYLNDPSRLKAVEVIASKLHKRMAVGVSDMSGDEFYKTTDPILGA